MDTILGKAFQTEIIWVICRYINLSGTSFTVPEVNLLKKGFNHIVHPKNNFQSHESLRVETALALKNVHSFLQFIVEK